MFVRGSWQKRTPFWRRIALLTWNRPEEAAMYGMVDVDVGPLGEWLQQRSDQEAVKCTMTHAVVRAIGVLLKRYPNCNALVRRRRIWVRDEADVFVQVVMPRGDNSIEADMSGATIRKANSKRVETIASETQNQAELVRANKDGQMAANRRRMALLPNFLLRFVLWLVGWLCYALNLRVPTAPRDPFCGAMVTNVGMLGIKSGFSPLSGFFHNPITIVIGQVEQRAVVRDGKVEVRSMCSLGATIDHRVLDGYQAGVLATDLQKMLEQPELLDDADSQNVA